MYEMPFGLVFRKAVLWHEGKPYLLRNMWEIRNDREDLLWNFRCAAQDGFRLEAAIDGHGPNIHHLPYEKTDCSGSFEVLNNSLARATVSMVRRDRSVTSLETMNGAVLEMSGYR